MSTNFKLYSSYYDLLYQDKDYAAEAVYIRNHLSQLLPQGKKLLELGSGTGNHARYLSGYGYQITGVERSVEMIQVARSKSIKGFNTVLADICNFTLDQQFDAAVSLFHSICYLTTNEELLTAFKNIAGHLKPGAIFAFDFWYGPAVLHHLPLARVKYQQNEWIEVSRSGETTMFIDKNVAEVNYEIIIRNKIDGQTQCLKETHPMRYFSIPELALIATQTGFSLLGFEEFLTGNQLTLETRNVFMILQKSVIQA